jgi:hypothetical protein
MGQTGGETFSSIPRLPAGISSRSLRSAQSPPLRGGSPVSEKASSPLDENRYKVVLAYELCQLFIIRRGVKYFG